jgi:hypothetical protein
MPKFVSLAVLLLSACATSHPEARKDLLLFLQDGVTTRADVRMRIAQAPHIWCDGSIWTLRIGENTRGLFATRDTTVPGDTYSTQADEIHAGWTDARYSLVLEFGPDNRLLRHALVDVKGP